jgi:hypothetical protein
VDRQAVASTPGIINSNMSSQGNSSKPGMVINAPGARAAPQNGQTTTRKLVMKPLKCECHMAWPHGPLLVLHGLVHSWLFELNRRLVVNMMHTAVSAVRAGVHCLLFSATLPWLCNPAA